MIGRKVTPSAQSADQPKSFDDFELRLGDVMRGERATLSKSLLDVQRELKIKASYIAAIENADASAFDTPGFVAGYVRSYARYLGLDPDWAFRRFCAEAGFEVAHGMSAAASGPKPGARRIEYDDPLANPNASFVPRGEAFMNHVEPRAIGSILVLAMLVAGLTYGAFTVVKEVQKVTLAPVDQAPGVVTELDPLSQATASLAAQGDQSGASDTVALPMTDTAVANDALDRLYRPQALDTPVMVARDGPIAAIDPSTVGVLPDTKSATDQAVASALEAVPLGSTPVQVVAADAPAVELLAVRPSWVRVQAADGTVIFEKILDAGERYALPKTEEPPLLRAGNSGSVYFAVNGTTYGPAAPGAQVVKNLKLSPEALVEAFAVADLTQDADLAKFVSVAAADPSQITPVNPTDAPVVDPLAVPGQ